MAIVSCFTEQLQLNPGGQERDSPMSHVLRSQSSILRRTSSLGIKHVLSVDTILVLILYFCVPHLYVQSYIQNVLPKFLKFGSKLLVMEPKRGSFKELTLEPFEVIERKENLYQSKKEMNQPIFVSKNRAELICLNE